MGPADPYRRLPSHRFRLDRQRQPVRDPRTQAPARRRHPSGADPASSGRALLRQHLARHGIAADGRLFRGSRGGMLSESVYGRVWHAARAAALDPDLAATPVARRPYDLRHAALSLWLSATRAPAEIAARAGNSVRVLHSTYTHCIDGHSQVVSQQIERVLSHSRVAAGGPPVAQEFPDTSPVCRPLYVRAQLSTMGAGRTQQDSPAPRNGHRQASELRKRLATKNGMTDVTDQPRQRLQACDLR